MTLFGDNLRRAREGRELTRQQVADTTKIAPSTIARIETEPDANPTVDVLATLADAVGLTLPDLFSSAGGGAEDRGARAAVVVADSSLAGLQQSVEAAALAAIENVCTDLLTWVASRQEALRQARQNRNGTTGGAGDDRAPDR